MKPGKKMEVKKVPLGKIKTEENSRFRDPQLDELMVSLKQDGLLQPVGITPTGRGATFDVVFGNRRLAAAKKLGWKSIDAMIVPMNKTSKGLDFLVMNLAENLQRKDVTPFEEGRYFKELIDTFGMTEKEISARLGVSSNRVKKSLTLFNSLPAEFRDKTVYRTDKTKAPAGKINATLAADIIGTSKKAGFTRATQRKLLSLAQAKKVTPVNFRMVREGITSGMNVTDALKRVENTRFVRVTFAVDADLSERLEDELEMRIEDVIRDAVRSDLDLKEVLVS